MPGSWLIASVCMEWMKQSSCATLPVCGINSLTHAPSWLLAYLLNLKIEGATGKRACPLVIPVSLCPWRIESGRS